MAEQYTNTPYRADDMPTSASYHTDRPQRTADARELLAPYATMPGAAYAPQQDDLLQLSAMLAALFLAAYGQHTAMYGRGLRPPGAAYRVPSGLEQRLAPPN